MKSTEDQLLELRAKLRAVPDGPQRGVFDPVTREPDETAGERSFVMHDFIQRASALGWTVLPSRVIRDRDPGDEHVEPSCWSGQATVLTARSSTVWRVAELALTRS